MKPAGAGWKRMLSVLILVAALITTLFAPAGSTEIYAGSDEEPDSAAEEYQEPVFLRLAGKDRFATSFAIADALRKAKGPFQNIVVASGLNYPDALSACYLAKVKDAPLLLTDTRIEAQLVSKIRGYTLHGATVYLIGGPGSVDKSLENRLKADGYNTRRLAGKDRFETNLAILNEVWEKGKPLLVASGLNYPDSLSASAVPAALLLVGNRLTPEQIRFLKKSKASELYILGGSGSVSFSIQNQIAPYVNRAGIRLGGQNRYETSALIAREFFPGSEAVVLASGLSYPDGLSGGPLAAYLEAPLLLVANNQTGYARRYVVDKGAYDCYVCGGEGSVSTALASEVMATSLIPLAKLRNRGTCATLYSGDQALKIEVSRALDESSGDEFSYGEEVVAVKVTNLTGKDLVVITAYGESEDCVYLDREGILWPMYIPAGGSAVDFFTPTSVREYLMLQVQFGEPDQAWRKLYAGMKVSDTFRTPQSEMEFTNSLSFRVSLPKGERGRFRQVVYWTTNDVVSQVEAKEWQATSDAEYKWSVRTMDIGSNYGYSVMKMPE
ncbi:MAG: cell wall-binding repeat-containing protein [Firmicutes bacterium]|nr:cell wall-binding repeat-containing protein [Bacillota bacterium]